VTAPVISPARYDAVIFDLDGVVTDTASVHAAAWRKLFDEYLASRPSRAGRTICRSPTRTTAGSSTDDRDMTVCEPSSPLAGSPRIQWWCELSAIAKTSTSWNP
jgi:hypothetical protein